MKKIIFKNARSIRVFKYGYFIVNRYSISYEISRLEYLIT